MDQNVVNACRVIHNNSADIYSGAAFSGRGPSFALLLQRAALLPRPLLGSLLCRFEPCGPLGTPLHAVAPFKEHERDEETVDEGEHREAPACVNGKDQHICVLAIWRWSGQAQEQEVRTCAEAVQERLDEARPCCTETASDQVVAVRQEPISTRV